MVLGLATGHVSEAENIGNKQTCIVGRLRCCHERHVYILLSTPLVKRSNCYVIISIVVGDSLEV